MKITNRVNNASSSRLITRVCLSTATVKHQAGNARGHKRAIQYTEIFDLSTIPVYLNWDPIGTATLCTLIDTNFCKPDDGQTRPKHVPNVTSCSITNGKLCCVKTV